MEHDRVLQAGRDYPLWPYLKWGHASRLSQRLNLDYQMWRGSLGVETRPEYSEDRCVVTFYARLATSAPAHEWSLAFGDVIHNYRSALDSLAWAMANLDGNRPDPRYEKQIYFPMKKTREAFEKEAETKLASVPGFVLARMQQVQPYHVQPGQIVEDGIALVLHDLDIADKHKAAVETQAVARDKTTYGIEIRWLDDDVHGDAYDSTFPEWIAPEGAISDGDPIVRWTFPKPVKEAEISNLPLVLTVRRGETVDNVFELLRLIDQQVALTFALIETGRFMPQS